MAEKLASRASCTLLSKEKVEIDSLPEEQDAFILVQNPTRIGVVDWSSCLSVARRLVCFVRSLQLVRLLVLVDAVFCRRVVSTAVLAAKLT
jgi:hypothetical protein